MNQHAVKDAFTGEVLGWCNEAKINAIFEDSFSQPPVPHGLR